MRSKQRTFQHSLILAVADKYVGNGSGALIHYPRYRNAELLIAVTPHVLNGGEHSGI